MIIDKVRWLITIAFVVSSVAARAEPPPATGGASATPPTETGPLQPPAPAPKETPPAPATQTPPPPPQAQPIEPPPGATTPRAVAPPPAPAPPAGQWVYTRQYGWLWMPYERAYTHVVSAYRGPGWQHPRAAGRVIRVPPHRR